MKEIIFIIDDDVATILVHRMVLKKKFAESVIIDFTSAKVALEFLKIIENTDHFHFTIFLDIYMPEMSGWEFLENIEKNLEFNCKVHVITISINPEDKLKCENYKSVYSFIEKPLIYMKLADLN